MKPKLPAVVLYMLKKRGSAVDSKLRASRAQLVETCKEYGYALHPSVIEFEAAFGGMEIPEEREQKKGEPSWLFGAHACVTSGAHVDPRGGSKARKLVPVVYSPNDVIYYLDEKGRAFAEDTIEDEKATLFADNATALVCRIVLNDAMFSCSEDTSLDLPGLQGEALAEKLSLALLTEANGKDFRYFSDAKGSVLVVEDMKAKRTRVACATKTQFKLVSPPAVGGEKVPSELKPYVGKASIRMVSEQRTTLPDFFERLPDLRDLDVSINKLETLPESLWRATQLTKLDISFNPLTTLPDGIGHLKSLNTLIIRGCKIKTLPEALVGAKNLTWLVITESEALDVDAALLTISKLPKLKELSLPLSRSLTSVAPLASLPLKSLTLTGASVKHPIRLPSGLGMLKKLTDLRIGYADDVAQLPEAPEDVRALRLLFAKRFTDDDVRQSALKQPEKLYLRAFADTL